MSIYGSRRIVCAAALIILTAACHRESAILPDRLLLLPLENLTGDAGLDWQTTVSSAVLDYDLSAAPNLTVIRGDSVGSIPEANASSVLQGYLSKDRDKLSIHATLGSSPGSHTERVIAVEVPPGEGIALALDRIAKQIRPEARAFCTRDQAALQTYGNALRSPDLKIRAGLFETAATQDPNFSAASIALATTLLETGQGQRAAQVAGFGAKNAKDPIDRAQLQYLFSMGTGDLNARERALDSLVSLLPANSRAVLQLAQTQTAERRYRDAIATYERLAKLEPRNLDAYNQTAYLQAYLHDLNSARASIGRYRELAGPADFNPSDSLGEVNFLTGQFGAAEEAFLDAYAKNPSAGRELLKAAEARLLTGDIARADQLFSRYLGTAIKNLAALQQAQWEFISGRGKQAFDRLQTARAAFQGDEAALATAQLAVWTLQGGDRSNASKLSAEATAQAVSPQIRNLAALCAYLSSSAPGATPLPLFNGMALMLANRYAEAIPIFENIMRQTPPAQDGEVRTWLAWCYWKSGNPAAAKPLVDLYPLIFPAADSIFASLTYPGFTEVRAAVLH